MENLYSASQQLSEEKNCEDSHNDLLETTETIVDDTSINLNSSDFPHPSQVQEPNQDIQEIKDIILTDQNSILDKGSPSSFKVLDQDPNQDPNLDLDLTQDLEHELEQEQELNQNLEKNDNGALNISMQNSSKLTTLTGNSNTAFTRNSKEISDICFNPKNFGKISDIGLNSENSKEISDINLNPENSKEISDICLNPKNFGKISDIGLNLENSKEISDIILNPENSKDISDIGLNIENSKEISDVGHNPEICKIDPDPAKSLKTLAEEKEDSVSAEQLLKMASTSMCKSWKLFGVEFAPLLVPLERRIQTLSVVIWFGMAILLGTVSTLVLGYMTLFTSWWWIALAYFTWMIVDRKCQEQGGRSDWIKDWVRNWSLWRHYCNYFPIRLIKTVELDPSKNYVFGSHPHGLLASGTFGALATEGAGARKLFPGLKINVHTLGLNFWFPINREWILGLGGVSASRESISYLLRKPGGMVSVIVVGGAAESMFSSESQVSLVLNKRKGFIKIALQHGAQLVPTFSFGEAHIYNIMNTQEGTWIRNLQEKFRNIVGFAPVLFLGRGMFQYNFGLIPHRKPVNVVVGEPIRVEKTPNPTVEEIEDLHKQYVTALVQLYDKYNPVYGDTNISLNIL